MLILFRKSQLALFDAPVHVAASVRKDGTVVKPHTRIQKIALKPAKARRAASPDGSAGPHDAEHGGPHTPDLFTAPPQAEQPAPQREPEPAEAPAAAPQPEIVEHVTRKGKTLRGVIRHDLTAEEAKAIDEYTFKKDGGWFIREKHLELAQKLDAARESGAITDEQHGEARAAGAKDGPAGALAVLTPEAVLAEVEPATPKDGDTKTEDGVEYVLRDGQWHRSHEEPTVTEEQPEATTEEAPEPPPQQSPEFELAEARVDLEEEQRLNPGSEREQQLKRQIAHAESGGGDENDPNSPNYRFADTGQIAGSRKERAALHIRQAARSGQRLRMTDIDWDEIEQNPREADSLITKSNLFGKVDWEALRDGGMEPGAGFLLDRVYAAIGSEPDGDSPGRRRDFALGLETLRDRMERCTTPQQVTDVLGEIADEISGEMLSASESVEYRAIMDSYQTARRHAKEQEKHLDALRDVYNRANADLNSATYEQDKRKRRGWKPDPDLDAKIAELQAGSEAAGARWEAYRHEHPELVSEKRDLGNGYVTYENELEFAARQIRMKADAILSAAKGRNLMSNPLTRAWATLGGRFLSVVHWRRGSEAFAKHVHAAKTGKVPDWSWAERDIAKAPRSTKQQVHFQLAVAENFERVGGRHVRVDSTAELKGKFNLRDIQSGNWVLQDVDSAAFHVQKSAEAFSDLADILGVPDDHVSMNGRLAMAFGARGRGNAGWKGAARAHWEPVHRVINLTKMGGGGALAHEWFHALDNMIREAEGSGQPKVDEHASADASGLPAGELREAFEGLRRAMTTGGRKRTHEIAYTDRDLRIARYNIDGRSNPMATSIRTAANASAAVSAVDAYYIGRYGAPENMKRGTKKQYEDWRRLAVAYHDKNEAGGTGQVESGMPMSSFQYEAINLDNGEHGKYWSSVHEMAARAFQSYVEDKLAGLERRNDYLSWGADNKYHVDPISGPQFPYPDGDERTRINAAFDRLFAVLGQRGSLAKAMAMLVGDEAA